MALEPVGVEVTGGRTGMVRVGKHAMDELGGRAVESLP